MTSMDKQKLDISYMRLALAYARRGVGTTFPNPSVGCVLVQDGECVAAAVTAPGGRPHAEILALQYAGKKAKGATAYVTLEPCSHYGETSPCAKALIEAGISRVVIAIQDPNPKVAGAGIVMVQAAGVTVEQGLLEKEAYRVNQGFFSVHTRARPLIALKIASTMDGKVATATGESQWVTDGPSRRYGHFLRASYDAIMVGSGTVRKDNPLLTCRLPGCEDRNPVRVIISTSLDTGMDMALIHTAHQVPTWIVTTSSAAGTINAYIARGCRVMVVKKDAGGYCDLHETVQMLAKEGVTRLLVEGGPTLATAFLRQQLVDRIYWFHAPAIMGEDGKAGFGTLAVPSLSAMPVFKPIGVRSWGRDTLTVMERPTF